MGNSIFAPGYRSEPYWWGIDPWFTPAPGGPPARCDVAIVGSGYTGLAAAIELARGGRRVAILEAEDAGGGCSSRNGGQVSTSVKPSFAELRRLHGEKTAFGIRREGLNALQWIEDFIEREKIDCNYERVGRFQAAHTAGAFAQLARDAKNQPKGLSVDFHLVSRQEQRKEIGSDFYHGGIVYPADGLLHPAKYHRGMLEKALAAGATISTRCPVTAIERQRSGFDVQSLRGTVQAREVIIATNGYTTDLTPWLRRRIIPIGSYIIATQLLEVALTQKLIPNNRAMSDTRKLIFYYRLSEDRKRVIFGGRVAARESNPRLSAPMLHRHMTQIFPELASTQITHSWGGTVAYTFDTLPHFGRGPDGLHYCLGYCGSGVSLASYFGTRLAQQLLGRREGATALDNLEFKTRPLYNGYPWFLPLAVAYYRVRDRLQL
jgi:glycine/D-amino acid oxidase-like deaminating enzyme